MSTAPYSQSRKYKLSAPRWLQTLVAVVGLARAVSTQAVGVYFQNNYGLVSPSNVVTFSEYNPPPNAIITTEYQAYGVSFTPYVHYASIYNQTSGTPHIDPTACVANFVQYGPVVPKFSIVFDRPVSAAAFAVLSQPGTFEVTALWEGIEVPGGPHTFIGGFGPQSTNNFVGLGGATFDELRVSNIATSDGALVVDNIQFSPVPINSWTNIHSGRWDSVTNWSLDTLPASTQTVYIANDGYKAVNIDFATFTGFSNSMTVSNLFVAAPTNALSTLLLNYAGLDATLKVLSSCVIGTNGTIDNFSSSFEVDGNGGGKLLLNGGTFNQVGGLTVVNGPVLVRSGYINVTNANLTLGDVTLDSVDPVNTLNQDSSSIAVQHLNVHNGRYSLFSGTLYAIGGTVIDGGGNFLQWGGTNYGDVSVNAGAYDVSGGMLKGNSLSVSSGFGVENGAVLDMQSINWFGPYATLGGHVRCNTFNITNTFPLYLAGDIIVTNTLTLKGAKASTFLTDLVYLVGGGVLHAGTIGLHDFSRMDQYEGSTNEVSSGLTLEGSVGTRGIEQLCEYQLLGGLLESPYLNVGLHALFIQQSGLNQVHGVLSISGNYEFFGGQLVADGIWLGGSLVLQAPTNSSSAVTNTGLMDLNGNLVTGLPDAWPGQVRLSAGATIGFLGSPAQLHFSSSSTMSWTSGAVLSITNWNSSQAGDSHIYFGANSSGLNASQLGQIRFVNPGGFSPGIYPARLTATGELAPVGHPALQSARNGSGLVLNWPGGFQLLSATNVTGPYAPVPGASSPWTNLFTKPQEFFRLQGL
jgi:hypothetical protein